MWLGWNHSVVSILIRVGSEYSLEHSQRIAGPAPIARRACLDEILSALQSVDLMAFSAQQLSACSMEQLLDLFLVFLQGFLRPALCRQLFPTLAQLALMGKPSK